METLQTIIRQGRTWTTPSAPLRPIFFRTSTIPDYSMPKPYSSLNYIPDESTRLTKFKLDEIDGYEISARTGPMLPSPQWSEFSEEIERLRRILVDSRTERKPIFSIQIGDTALRVYWNK